jgi:hypothetical protein
MRKSDALCLILLFAMLAFVLGHGIGWFDATTDGRRFEQGDWTCTKRIVSSGVCVEQVRKAP